MPGTTIQIEETPWGTAQQIDIVAEGITFYSTASHGGFHLSPRRLATMPQALFNEGTFIGHPWFEEDCDWAIVYLSFPVEFLAFDGPEKFKSNTEGAKNTLRQHHRKAFELFYNK